MEYDISQRMRQIALSRNDEAIRSQKSEATINAYQNAMNLSRRRSSTHHHHQPRPPNSNRPKVTVVSPTRRANVKVSSLNDLKQVKSENVLGRGVNKEDSKSHLRDGMRLHSPSSSDGSCDCDIDYLVGVDKDDDYDDDYDDDDDDVDDDGDDDVDQTADDEDDLDEEGSIQFDKRSSSDEEELDDDIYEEVTESSDDDMQSNASLATSDVGSVAGHIDNTHSFQYSAMVQNYPLLGSLFSCKPPTLMFTVEGEKVQPFPWDVRRALKWKSSSVTPKIVKSCVNRTGFRLMKNNSDWLCVWGKHMKPVGFKSVKEYQKVNHFPGTFHIGRKDKLWRNYVKMRALHGRKEFNFLPHTYILPNDIANLRKAWDDTPGKNKWIVKPPASARGIGIKVVHRWGQIPKKKSVIVQKYLAKPYIINGRKFDLRIYVFVTGYDPLRVYIFRDGLVRFATTVYSSSSKSLSNKYMHLTNYSINKKNKAVYSSKENGEQGSFKWSVKSLWKYLENRGINTKKIWDTIKDICVKAILCGEAAVTTLHKHNTKSRYSCFELFGLDVILDHRLKPWLLEVNISPSLHSQSELDKRVKGELIKDILNMIGIYIPKSVLGSATGKYPFSRDVAADAFWFEQRILTGDEKAKHTYFLQRHLDVGVKSTVLNVLTPDDALVLMQIEDESMRSGNFDRIFPPPSQAKNYMRFFEVTKYYDLLVDEWTKQYPQNSNKSQAGLSRLQAIASEDIHLRSDSKIHEQHKWSHVRQNFQKRSKSVPPKPKSHSAPPAEKCRNINTNTTNKTKHKENSFVLLQRAPKQKISVNCIFRKDSTLVRDSRREFHEKKKRENLTHKVGRLKKSPSTSHISVHGEKSSSVRGGEKSSVVRGEKSSVNKSINNRSLNEVTKQRQPNELDQDITKYKLSKLRDDGDDVTRDVTTKSKKRISNNNNKFSKKFSFDT